jgi:hypothetical protein
MAASMSISIPVEESWKDMKTKTKTMKLKKPHCFMDRVLLDELLVIVVNQDDGKEVRMNELLQDYRLVTVDR